MKKFLLGVFILFNVALIAGGVFVLYNYLSRRLPRSPAAPRVSSPARISVITSSGSVSASPLNPSLPSGSSPQTKIFSYRNSHAKHVAIRADFTGWKAEAMQRDAAGVWTYRAVLSPGEYAYCYTVDDKPPLKDPVNTRTKTIGRAVVSAIIVGAPPAKPAK